MKEKVEATIEKIRPFLQRDGGDIELIDFDENTKSAKVRLQGACKGCPGAQMTLKLGVERTLREEVDPNITVVTA
ncbi:MAG: NifU family protein [Candidatus Lernaella stagnicola]|nr:NifU family protein [Candidatus Lernaella stagnicola]